jgi:hypothetical protein
MEQHAVIQPPQKIRQPKVRAVRPAAARRQLSGRFDDETADMFHNLFQNVSRSFGHSRVPQKMTTPGEKEPEILRADQPNFGSFRN